MEGVTGWYVILSVAIIIISVVLRFTTYTFLVHQSRWLPEKARTAANIVSGIVIGIGIIVLGGKALFFSR